MLDVRNLEERDLGGVHGVAADDQTGRGLRARGRRGVRHRRHIRHGVHRDRGRDDGVLQASICRADRSLHVKAERGHRTEEVRARRELQACETLRLRDEAACADRRRAVVLEERAAEDVGDLVVRRAAAVSHVCRDDQTAAALHIFISLGIRQRRSEQQRF